MSYVLHATGKSVTVAKAEKFQKDVGCKIQTGYNGGGWFCFKFPKASNFVEDKKLALSYFPDAFVETGTARIKRMEAARKTAVAPTPLLLAAKHHEIAQEIVKRHAGASKECCDCVGAMMRELVGDSGHNALDYYAVQDCITKELNQHA